MNCIAFIIRKIADSVYFQSFVVLLLIPASQFRSFFLPN